MDNFVLDSDGLPSQPAAGKILKQSNRRDLDAKCYVEEHTERKTNLYTKRNPSQAKRNFEKVGKLVSPVNSFPTDITDFGNGTESLRNDLDGRETSESDFCDGNSTTGDSRGKSPSPIKTGFIQDMVDRFDRHAPNADDKISYFKMPQGEAVQGRNDYSRVQHKGLLELNNSQRVRSKSENCSTNVSSGTQLKHSRSDKPSPAPKPKPKRGGKLPSKYCQEETPDVKTDFSAKESPTDEDFCMERSRSSDSTQSNDSTENLGSGTSSIVTSFTGCNDLNRNAASRCLNDCKDKLSGCGDLGIKTANPDFEKVLEDGFANDKVDRFDDDTHQNEREDLEDLNATNCSKLHKTTERHQLSGHSSSSSSSRKLVQKKSFDQKVPTASSQKRLDLPAQAKVIYVNDADSEKVQTSASNSSDAAVVPTLKSEDKDNEEDSKCSQISSHSDGSPPLSTDQRTLVTNDPNTSDDKLALSVCEGDDLLYEIAFHKTESKSVSDFCHPYYELPPRRVTSGATTPKAVSPVRASNAQQPSRGSRLSSPGSSPLPSPRKLSKGHIDVSKLSQVVLPPTPAVRVTGADTTMPPLLPRVQRLSSNVHSPVTSAPLILPRKSSNVQTLQHVKPRKLPPPPIAEVPPAVQDSSEESGISNDPPAVPERGFRRQGSPVVERPAAGMHQAKRSSAGKIQKAYETKCVEVDSSNPSKASAHSALSSSTSRSMNDLRRLVHNRGSTLSLHVPPPTGDEAGDGPVSPSRSEGYLQQISDGYIPMGSQRSSSISSRLSSRSDSLSDVYLMQNSPNASDGSPVIPPRGLSLHGPSSETKNQLDRIVTRDNFYLQLCPDDDYDKYSYLSLYGDNEPLYQIYHQGAVVRQVLEQNIDSDEDYDNYYNPQEYVEHAKSCVSDILKRDNGTEHLDSEKAIKGLSTLESAAKCGTGFRKLWCEMPKVKESGLLNHMTPEECRLQESLFEILSSEASYLKSLNLLVCHFMGMLAVDMANKEKHVLSKQDFNWLFSNARAVRSTCIIMLDALEKLWQEGCVINPLRLCGIISEVAQEHYGVYVTYCSNAIYQERKLKELNEKSPEFRNTVRRLEDFPDCHSLPLSSFLALPMQRVTRMPLLVTALCRRLKPDEESSPEVTRCIHVLQKVVKQCNEGARKMSNLEQMNNINKILDFRSVKRIPLISQTRFLVKKGFLVHIINQPTGFLKKSKRTLFFFLFNDLLIITKKKSDKQFEVLDYSPRSHIYAEAIEEEDALQFLAFGVPSGCSHLFNMVLIDKGAEFVLSCESQSEKMRWIQAVTPVEKDTEEEVVYVEWDCPQVQAIRQYVSTEPDELSLEESDIVNVLRKMNDGWYEGERIRDGERGWFPAHCTVEIQNAHVRARNLRQQYQLMKKSGKFSYVG